MSHMHNNTRQFLSNRSDMLCTPVVQLQADEFWEQPHVHTAQHQAQHNHAVADNVEAICCHRACVTCKATAKGQPASVSAKNTVEPPAQGTSPDNLQAAVSVHARSVENNHASKWSRANKCMHTPAFVHGLLPASSLIFLGHARFLTRTPLLSWHWLNVSQSMAAYSGVLGRMTPMLAIVLSSVRYAPPMAVAMYARTNG